MEPSVIARVPLRLLDMVAYTAAALLGGKQAFIGRGRADAWRVVGSSRGAGQGLTGRTLAGASVLPFGGLVRLEITTSGEGPVRVAQTGSAAHAKTAAHATTEAVGYAARGRDDHFVVVVVERPQLDDAAEQLTRLAEVHAAAVDAVAEATENESRLRVGLEEREEERRRWARELHDETLQQMGALQVLLTTVRQRSAASEHSPDPDLQQLVDNARDLVQSQIKELRHLITELRPATLDDLGLGPPLHALAERTEQLTGLPVTMQVSLRYSDGDVSTRLLPDVELAIYRVVQEALTNIRRHSGANRADVSVVEVDGLIHVEVRDDGRGLTDTRAVGFGVPGMRERAQLAGGTLQVLTGDEAGDDWGTVVRMVLPAVHRDPEPKPDPGSTLRPDVAGHELLDEHHDSASDDAAQP